jgi:cold-inducible RNA-binding protein
MSRSSQTQQKRQRENKLREKAQLKRERRQQRQAEKKISQSQGGQAVGDELLASEIQPRDDDFLGLELGGAGGIIPRSLEQYEVPAGSVANQADSERRPQNGGDMASKLFVGNLPRDVTDAELTEFVTSAGFQVTSAQVIRDRMTGDTKGFGFVELGGGADLQQAIESLNGKMLNDRRVTVNEARPQRSGFSGSRGGGSNFGGGGGFGRKRGY